MNNKIREIADRIKSGNRFLVATHINPDGDAVGSALALAIALEQMEKEVVVYDRDPVPYQFRFLPTADRVVNNLENIGTFDAAFIVDCSEPDRVGQDFSQQVSTKCWINIDHHLTNENFADITLIDKNACSTGYLIYELSKSLPITITKDMAINIYTTIIVDTGSFRYSNSNNDAFRTAGEMVDLGVSPWDVAMHVYENQPRRRLELLTRVLNTLEVSEGGQVASITVTKEMMNDTCTGPDETDGFVNYPRSIEGVEVAFMVREIGNNEYKISYRSKGRVNVAAVCQSFGGGGHKNAAGCILNGSMADVRAMATRAVYEELSRSCQ